MYDAERNNREIEEALAAGRAALDSLNRVNQSLSSAKGFGIWDMLGGGFVTGMLKHSKIDRASAEMENAKMLLGKFQKELRDVSMHPDMHIDIGSFAVFADFFLDNIVSDWYVQSKINQSKEQVEEAIEHVETALNNLESMRR